jgi:hypothetical protein
MKKIIAAIGAASLIAISTHAQGLVNFTSSTQNVQTNNSLPALGATASGKILGQGNYYFALFYSVSSPAIGAHTGLDAGGSYAWDSGSWTSVTGTLATNTAVAGRFAGAENADSSTTVNGLAGGADAYFIVIGWSANLGTSLAAVEAAMSTPGSTGFLGQSVASGLIETGDGGTITTPGLFGGVSPNIQGFTLGSFAVPVPEPGTLALSALGGASLLLFRRKK